MPGIFAIPGILNKNPNGFLDVKLFGNLCLETDKTKPLTS